MAYFQARKCLFQGGELPLILTIDPNFLGHPSKPYQMSLRYPSCARRDVLKEDFAKTSSSNQADQAEAISVM